MTLTKVTYSMIKDSTFNVLDYGAVADGVTDDTNAIIAASNALQANGGGKLLFPSGTYLIYKNGVTYSQYPIVLSGISGIVIDFSQATIKLDQSKNWNGINAAFIRASNVKDLTVLGGYFNGVPITLDGTFSGVEVISLRGDCSGITVPHLRVDNSLAAILMSTPVTTGCTNIWVGTLEATGCVYGINGANSGSNMVVSNLVTDTCGRSFFIYGVRHVKANIKSKDFKFSADCALAAISPAFPILEDIEVSYTNTQSSTSASHGIGVSLGQSYGEMAAVQLSDIRVHLDVVIGDSGMESAFEFSKIDSSGNPDPLDRGHLLTGLTISGTVNGTPSTGGSIQLGRNYAVWSGTDKVYEIHVENLRLSNSTSFGIDAKRIMPSLKGGLYLTNINSSTDIDLWGSGDPEVYDSTDANARVFVTNIITPNLDSYDSVVGTNGVRTIAANDTPFTVLNNYNGLTLTNYASGGVVTYNLPVSVAGLQFSFASVLANNMHIDPNGSEVIRGGGAGKYLSLDSVGASVTLLCRVSGYWDIIQSNGTTSFEA